MKVELNNVVKIEYWYDRSLRLWTILKMDRDGNQIGDADYEPRIDDLNLTLDEMRKEYPNAVFKKD
jgi:hypothetical protein